MPITFTIADELAQQFQPYQGHVSEILALGIREWQARNDVGYNGVHSFLEKLAALPTPEEVLALRPAPVLQERIDALLEKNRTSQWDAGDQQEWGHIQYLEHLVRLAKASAARKLKGAKAS